MYINLCICIMNTNPYTNMVPTLWSYISPGSKMTQQPHMRVKIYDIHADLPCTHV